MTCNPGWIKKTKKQPRQKLRRYSNRGDTFYPVTPFPPSFIWLLPLLLLLLLLLPKLLPMWQPASHRSIQQAWHSSKQVQVYSQGAASAAVDATPAYVTVRHNPAAAQLSSTDIEPPEAAVIAAVPVSHHMHFNA